MTVRKWLIPAAVAAITFAAFWPVLGASFVWDDNANILNTVGFRGLGWRNLRWMWTTFHMGPYQPLSWMSYALDYQLWGMNPFGYHLSNLLIHCANAVLFFILAKELLGKEMPAAFAALVFSIHPLRAESVAWVTERRDVLSGFFFLLTLIFYIRRRTAASLICCALSLLSKSMGVTVPVLLLILDYYPLNRREKLVKKLPYALLAAAAAVIAIKAQATVGNLTPLESHGIAARLCQAIYGLAFYLRKTLWPAELSALYPLFVPNIAGSLLFLAGAAAALRAAGLAKRAQLALWAWYAVSLLPVIGLLQNGPQIAALRYSYLPCLGWALLGGAAAAKAPKALCLLALGSAFFLTQAQARVWRDEVSLWSNAARFNPDSPDIRLNLANALVAAGRIEEALGDYTRVLVIRPGDGLVLLNQGYALLKQNRLKEALPVLEEALRKNPVSPDVHNCLGDLKARQGRLAEAARHFQTVCELQPHSETARKNLEAVRSRIK